MAKKKKRSAYERDEQELHEERRYGFFWYDWIWRIVRPVLVFAASFVIVCGLIYTGLGKVNDMFFSAVDMSDTQVVEFEVPSGSSLSAVSRRQASSAASVSAVCAICSLAAGNSFSSCGSRVSRRIFRGVTGS